MKEQLYTKGLALLNQFCAANMVPVPTVERLAKTERLYHLATCAYYRPTTITIMVEKCATMGTAGRQWSCPGYKIDRTPYGVLQHELGHHVDDFFTKHFGRPFSSLIYTGERPLTGYLGTDKRLGTFFKEWFAEHFRLFVTNPDLSYHLTPKFQTRLVGYLRPVVTTSWQQTLELNGAPQRTIEMAGRLCSR